MGKNGNRGVLTVEAAIIYPVFVIFIVTIVNFMNIFYIHAVVQQGINNTANRLAGLAYAVKIVDPDFSAFSLNAETNSRVLSVQSSYDELKTNTQTTVNSLSGDITLENIEDVVDSVSELWTSIDGFGGAVSAVEGKDLINYLMVSATDAAGGLVLKYMTEKYLEEMKLDMSVLSELDFNHSSVFKNENNNDIVIVVTYKYKNPLPFRFFDDITFVQSTVVRPWIGGVKKGVE